MAPRGRRKGLVRNEELSHGRRDVLWTRGQQDCGQRCQAGAGEKLPKGTAVTRVTDSW